MLNQRTSTRTKCGRPLLKSWTDLIAILIGKLRKYDIRDIAGDWIQSYLENRNQYCSTNGLNSGTKTITCGVLQSSCLGPLLFVIHSNDLEICLIDSKAGLYADDSHITVASIMLKV